MLLSLSLTDTHTQTGWKNYHSHAPKLHSYSSLYIEVQLFVCAHTVCACEWVSEWQTSRLPWCTTQIMLLGHGAQLSLSVIEYLHLFSLILSLWFSPPQFSHLALSPCPYLTQVWSPHTHTHHIVSSNAKSSLHLLLPTFFPHYVKRQNNFAVYLGTIRDRLPALGDVCRCTYKYIMHVSICGLYSQGINHSAPPAKSTQGGLRSEAERKNERMRAAEMMLIYYHSHWHGFVHRKML